LGLGAGRTRAQRRWRARRLVELGLMREYLAMEVTVRRGV
jgi:hypothetical protein